MNISLRQLEYVVAVARLRNFREAAAACHVSQSGLSIQLRQLEDHLGVQIFERDRRRVLVTAAGEEIVHRAERVLGEARGLVDGAAAAARPMSGVLRLGVIPTIAPYLLPAALPRLRKRYPEFRVRLREALTADLVEATRQGDLDLLLVSLDAPLGGLVERPLFDDPFVVALPHGHRLAARKVLSEADLHGEPVLLLDDGHCLRDNALAVCHAAGLDEASDFRAGSLNTLVQMVAAGDGITLLPSMAARVETRHSALALVPFRKPVPSRRIGLAWRPMSGRAAEYERIAPLFCL
jgi:LysR family transcriptional regulator, hydrogen peroxide-inducible genes activator